MDQPQREYKGQPLPLLPDEDFAYYQRCSTGVVERHHMCGGCAKGQFYCDVFEKWRLRWHEGQED